MIEIKTQGTVNNAHQEFSAAIGSNVFSINMDWIGREDQKYWTVDIYVGNDPLIPLVTGAVFNPGMNLLDGIHGYGRFYCYGEQPTLDNVGISSFLIWVDEDEIQK